MLTSARVESRRDRHGVTLGTDGRSRKLAIPPKPDGFGSSASGGELLALALATCYCNDLYREAAARGIEVRAVEVEVEAEFGGAGEPARGIRYRVKVEADAPDEEVRRLVEHTDRVAEVHATLRGGIAVELESPDAPGG
ncbi:MAG TPA: OsmC family protein [Longimicrobiaceae bacterium]|nr:OsmC family protein [Longimicrobiaceae bacterium]